MMPAVRYKGEKGVPGNQGHLFYVVFLLHTHSLFKLTDGLRRILVNFSDLLVSFGDLLVNFTHLLVSLCSIPENFSDLLVNYSDLLVSLRWGGYSDKPLN
ncbi:hypothetical protein LJR015_002986 [Peribacillus frigoritolerans]|uniref:hypothetical protein n=1 Tax=Peribacillus frigoritolerans TaxID=450367 RepID=UPI003ECCD49D